jgi:MSHA biogenesis protein MshE
MPAKKIHLGKLLVEGHLITQEQLDKAMSQQKQTGQRLGQALVDLGFVEEEKLLELVAQQLKIPFINLKDYPLQPEIVARLPEFYARHFRALVLKKEDNDVYLVGLVEPEDILASDEISRILKAPINLALIREEELLQVIDMMYRRTSEISSFAEELSVELGENNFNAAQLGAGLSASDAPVVKLLESIFEDAVQMNASDIHIEPDENILRIRQRVDGVLHEQIIKEKDIAHALTLRLKLMAGINITEKRVPQDGRFSIRVKDKNYDVRLATLPIQFGESVVMRLLNQSAELLDLSKIGMPPKVLENFRRMIALPNGLILITGPTGSGKTTTLYGALKELNDAEKKIITVEDPVEYRMSRINQVQIAPAVDLTFARALRSILRQDPDIILVGELRDQETAAIAIRAAMTGHLVLSTLHTNDAVSSTMRLIDMGVESFLAAAVLRGIMAQRLVRRNCQKCVRTAILNTQEKMWLEAVLGTNPDFSQFKQGKGCNYCNNTGYKGQIGVYELLEWTSDMAEALRSNDPKKVAEMAAKQETFRPLVLSGLDLARQGVTSVSEVMRISDLGYHDLQELAKPKSAAAASLPNDNASHPPTESS